MAVFQKIPSRFLSYNSKKDNYDKGVFCPGVIDLLPPEDSCKLPSGFECCPAVHFKLKVALLVTMILIPNNA